MLRWLFSLVSGFDSALPLYGAFAMVVACTSAQRVVVHHAVDAACHVVVVEAEGGRAEEICATLIELSDVLTLLLAARDEKKPATFDVSVGGMTKSVTVPVEGLDRTIEGLISVGASPKRKK
jgi:hypothetical protein